MAGNGADSSQGLFSSSSAGTSTVQLGYGQENWGIAALYSYVEAGVGVPAATPFITTEIEENGVNTNAFAISGFWQPAESGWLPSISAGYGVNGSSGSDLRTSQSWMVGLQWSDVLAEGKQLWHGSGPTRLCNRHPQWSCQRIRRVGLGVVVPVAGHRRHLRDPGDLPTQQSGG